MPEVRDTMNYQNLSMRAWNSKVLTSPSLGKRHKILEEAKTLNVGISKMQKLFSNDLSDLMLTRKGRL